MAGPGDAGSKEVDWCEHRFATGWRMIAAAVCTDRRGMSNCLSSHAR